MISTADAFKKFKSRLELSTSEQQDASKRQKSVREAIEKDFDIDRSFLTGSYGRNTKTKPLKDVDIFFVLSEEEKWRRNKPPHEMLDAFKSTLEDEYGSDKVDVDGNNRRCVTVEFDSAVPTVAEDGKVLSVDAVPAFMNGDTYEIPDRILGKWIKTDPTVHKQRAVDKNAEMNGNWVPLVKMLKAWNRTNGKPIKPSFLVEVMALDLIDGPFNSYPDEVRRFFSSAFEGVEHEWPDPAGYGPPVSDQMTADIIQNAKKILRDAEKKTSKAAMFEHQGNQGAALRAWRDLLGDYFPLS